MRTATSRKSHPDHRSDRGGQRLKGAHALLTGLIALERKTTKQTAPALAELAHLHKARADGEDDARADQKIQQNAVPDDVADATDQISQLIHS